MGVERRQGEGRGNELLRVEFMWVIHTVVKEKKTGPFAKGGAELNRGVHRTHASGEGMCDDIHGSGGLELGEDVRE